MKFKNWVKEQDFSSVDLVIVLGLGNKAERPSLLRERCDAKILCFEPREHIRNRYSLVDNCLVSPNLISLRARIKSSISDLEREVVLVDDSEDHKDLGIENIEEIHQMYHEAVIMGLSRDTASLKFAGQRVSHMLSSMDILIKYPPINNLINVFHDLPGLIVGAGPSLDKNIELIKENQDKFIIAAVNSSLPALHKAGIVPDFCVVCEAKPIAETIKDVDTIPEIVMIPGIHVNRETWELPWLRKAPALSLEGIFGQWATKTLEVYPIPIGSSCVTLAAGTLQLLGCNPLVLVGCDCAPAETGEMYSSGAAFAGTTVEHTDNGTIMTKSESKLLVDNQSLDNPFTHMDTVRVLNWDKSKKIETMLVYDSIRQWFEEMSLTWKDNTLINSTEGGVFINNWESKKLEDVVKDISGMEFDSKKLICDNLDNLPVITKEKILKAFDEQIDSAEYIGDLAREGIALMERAREIQVLITEAKGGELLDAKCWGDIELARKDKDRPAFEVFKLMFQAIEKGSVELSSELRETRKTIDDN